MDHHIQRSIIYKLAFNEALRFSDLRPSNIENKLFDYHLKKVVHAGYVHKNLEGLYALTSEGRRFGVHVVDDSMGLIDQAHSVLFLVIRRKIDNAWLLYSRRSHPLLGGVGFMHALPRADESAQESAQRVCTEKTGLVADFRFRGSGFFRIYEGDDLESFTNFTLMEASDVSGPLVQNDELASYFWADDIVTYSRDMLPNMSHLLKAYEDEGVFFLDETIKS